MEYNRVSLLYLSFVERKIHELSLTLLFISFVVRELEDNYKSCE